MMDVELGWSNPATGNITHERPASETRKTSAASAGGSSKAPEGSSKEKPMEYVAPPGHGSGCGHCTAQAQWVPKEQADKARQQQKDRILADVVAHENAHKSAGKHLAGAPVVRQNSDGSADGEVPITVPKINKENPDQTISDGDIIMQAAMAPDKPSSQDYKVAQTGSALKAEAQAFKSSDEFKDLKPERFAPLG